MKITYRILRLASWFRSLRYKLFSQHANHTQTQYLAYKVVRKAILTESVELLIAPLSSMYYVNLENLNVRISDTRVQIVNGKYYYDIHMNEKLMEDLFKVFNRKVESRKHNVENKITNNTNKSLQNIYNDISNETTIRSTAN